MIAPQRIDTGMQDYLAQDQMVWGDERAQGWRLQQFKFLKNVRIWSDYLSYQWQSKVVGYDVEKQKNWLSRLGLDSTYGYVIILIVGIGGVLLFYVGFYWWRQRQQLVEYQRLIFKFQKQLPTPMHKRQAETFQTWMQRLMNSVEDHKSFEQVIVLYQKIVFMESNSPSDKQLFKKLLKDCAIAIKRSQKNL